MAPTPLCDVCGHHHFMADPCWLCEVGTVCRSLAPGRAVDPVTDPDYKRRKAHGTAVGEAEVRQALGLGPDDPMP